MDSLIKLFIGFFVVIIAISLIIWGGSILIVFLYAIFPGWGLTLVLGLVGFIIAQIKLNSDLKSASKISDLVKMTFENLNFEFEIKSDQLQSFSSAYNYYATLFCLISIVYLLYEPINHWGLLVTESEWQRLFGFDLSGIWVYKFTIIISSLIMLIFLFNPDFSSKVRTKIVQKMSNVKESINTSNELLDIVHNNRVLALNELQIEIEQKNLNEVIKYIDENKSNIISNPWSLEKKVKSEVLKANELNKKIKKAVKNYNDILEFHRKVSNKLISKGPSILNILNRIYRDIELAVINFLPQKKWDSFFAEMNSRKQELEKLHKQSESDFFEEDFSIHKKRDPYEILGVNPSVSNEEIKKAWRRLCQKYHPDKVDHLGERLKEVAEIELKKINDAYNNIKKDRNF